MQSNTVHRVAVLKVQRDGWTREGQDIQSRPNYDANGPVAVISAALRFARRLRDRADSVEYVLIAWDNVIWGVGRVVRVVTASEGLQFRDHPMWPLQADNENRGFLVDPFDVPKHIVELVGETLPENYIHTLAYGLLINGEIQFDSRAEAPREVNLDKFTTSEKPQIYATIEEARAAQAKTDAALAEARAARAKRDEELGL